MKLTSIVTLIAVTAGLAISGAACRPAPEKPAAARSRNVAYYTCPMHPSVKSDLPGSCHICGMDLAPVYTSDAATNNAPPNEAGTAAAKPYPLDYCLVSGEKLGVMGTPVVINYQGQEIKFCCPGCPAKFQKDPGTYLKKLQNANDAIQKVNL
jgi:hypothetical protein